MKRLFGLSTRDWVPGGFFYLSIVILLISFGFILLSQAIWDYDFWWHISTGRYIVETKSIPSADPFSFTSQMAENSSLYPEREKFILTQYWLAQVLMYLLYQYLGPAGIVLLRVGLLLGAIFAIYKALKDRGAAPYIIYLAIFLAALNVYRFFGDRPVLFTISFSVICFVLVDDYIRKRARYFFLLPVLMLLWANLHGGFILGDAIILVFMLIEAIKMMLGRSPFPQRGRLAFFLVLFITLGASCINPNGLFAFEIAFSSEYAPFYEGIQEYQAPFYLYINKLATPAYGYLTALFLFPVILVLRNKKFNPAHLTILILLAAESLMAARFTVYYGLMAALVLGNELDLWLKEHYDKISIGKDRLDIVFSLIMIVSSILYLSATIKPKMFTFRDSSWTVPKMAADFIESNNIKGNVFNDMATGGYLSWRLYPDVKTFVDTRALNYTVMREYSWIGTATKTVSSSSLPEGKIPLWKRLLDHYRINLIVFSTLDIYGKMLPLVVELLDDNSWVPVSADLMAVVFLKDIPENKTLIERFRVTNDVVYNILIIKATMSGQMHSQNPYYIESLGDIFLKIGREDDAITAYQYALNRMPDNQAFKEKLNNLRTKKTEVGK